MIQNTVQYSYDVQHEHGYEKTTTNLNEDRRSSCINPTIANKMWSTAF